MSTLISNLSIYLTSLALSFLLVIKEKNSITVKKLPKIPQKKKNYSKDKCQQFLDKKKGRKKIENFKNLKNKVTFQNKTMPTFKASKQLAIASIKNSRHCVND